MKYKYLKYREDIMGLFLGYFGVLLMFIDAINGFYVMNLYMKFMGGFRI